MTHKIFTWKTPTNYGDKKTTRSKTYQLKSTIRNQVTYIELVTLLLRLTLQYLNLIHVRDTTTTCCSLVDLSVPLKRIQYSTNNSNYRMRE